MATRRQPDGRYIVEFKLRGQRVYRRCPEGVTAEQAKELEARLRASIFGQIDLGKRPEVGLKDAIQVWLNEHVMGAKSEKATRNHAHQLEEWVDGKNLDQIVAVADAYRRRQLGVLAKATINNRLCVLKGVAKFAWKKGWIGENLSARIEQLNPNNKRKVYLTKAQVEKLIACCPRDDAKAFITLGAYTGMREGEIKQLTAASVRGDMLHLPDTKGNEPRDVPLLDEIRWTLAYLPFTLHQRRYYKLFELARDRAKLPMHCTFHDLRHSTASFLANAGVDLATVGVILGHKSAQTTKRYAHLYPETLIAAMRKIA